MARTFKQELVALFGQPVAENPTQAMIEAAFRHHGLDWRYLTIEVAPADLGGAVAGARAMGFRGFHCTIPHKVAVVPHLDALAASAEAIGAVNCVVRRDGRLVGENTDGRGFLEALRARRDPAGQSVVLLGAGGAARAIAVELLLTNAAAITVVNRNEERGRELVGHLEDLARSRGRKPDFRFVVWRGDHRLPPDTEVVVNATAIGLYPNVGERVPVLLDALPPGSLVADVIPNPPRTPFLIEAERHGLETVDGLEMLVNQGVLSVEYWTGVRPDAGVMRRALSEIFEAA